MTTEHYKTTQYESSPDGAAFGFYSTGKERIGKLVLYTFLDYRNGRLAYNLGFGDYDEKTNTVYDAVNSNNDDMRVVINTVAHTVPAFFEEHPDSIIIVQGSDSDDDELVFEQQCRPDCKKKCGEVCKKAGRRIRTYCWFVNKYFDSITEDYLVFGSYKENKERFKQYKPGEDYVSLMVYRKNSLPLQHENQDQLTESAGGRAHV